MRAVAGFELSGEAIEHVNNLLSALREAAGRQGVTFTSVERLLVEVARWDFWDEDSLETLKSDFESFPKLAPTIQVQGWSVLPSENRPGKVSLAIRSEELTGYVDLLRGSSNEALVSEEPGIALMRISPPSRKVGVALKTVFAQTDPRFSWMAPRFVVRTIDAQGIVAEAISFALDE